MAVLRPTKAALEAAAGRTIPDVLAPGLDVVFWGINPSLYSAATGYHFARPGNRFWPALWRSAFTPRLLGPAEQEALLAYRLGITNLVARGTARADELTADELRTGGQVLAEKLAALRPGWLAVLGIGAYRLAFGQAAAAVGPQPDQVAGVPTWVLPNPSGLNAHYTVDTLADEFRALRRHIATPESRPPA
jgi:double-stranded uracil-DNA glycosylase